MQTSTHTHTKWLTSWPIRVETGANRECFRQKVKVLLRLVSMRKIICFLNIKDVLQTENTNINMKVAEYGHIKYCFFFTVFCLICQNHVTPCNWSRRRILIFALNATLKYPRWYKRGIFCRSNKYLFPQTSGKHFDFKLTSDSEGSSTSPYHMTNNFTAKECWTWMHRIHTTVVYSVLKQWTHTKCCDDNFSAPISSVMQHNKQPDDRTEKSHSHGVH